MGIFIGFYLWAAFGAFNIFILTGHVKSNELSFTKHLEFKPSLFSLCFRTVGDR